MAKRVLIALNLVLTTMLVWSLLGQPGASGASATTLLNFAAVGFTPLNYSTNNNNATPACGAYVPQKNHTADTADVNGEFRGQLDNARGSFIHDVVLPQGATVQSFALFANDADADNDVFAFLIRRQIAPNPFPKNSGYIVMATVHSFGTLLDQVRRFATTNIVGGLVDNTRFMYFIEIVNCGGPEPFATRVGFTT
jgi:hypothetical protein